MNSMAKLVIALIMLSVAPTQVFALVPPWWTAFSTLQHTIGIDPRVTVAEPIEEQGSYKIYIRADNSDYLATALKILLNDTIYATEIVVQDQAGGEVEVSEVMTVLNTELIELGMEIAFGTNQYFHGTDTSSVPFVDVYFVAEKDLIQLSVDDLGSLYGRATYTAEELFDIILKDRVGDFTISCGTRFFLSPEGTGAS